MIGFLNKCIPHQSKVDFLTGAHSWADTYKAALFTSAATYDVNSTVYSTTGEVVSAGYTAGGKTLEIYAAGFFNAGSIFQASFDFKPVVWTGITADLSDGGIIVYNSSKSNRIVSVYGLAAGWSVTASTLTIFFDLVTTPGESNIRAFIDLS